MGRAKGEIDLHRETKSRMKEKTVQSREYILTAVTIKVFVAHELNRPQKTIDLKNSDQMFMTDDAFLLANKSLSLTSCSKLDAWLICSACSLANPNIRPVEFKVCILCCGD